MTNTILLLYRLKSIQYRVEKDTDSTFPYCMYNDIISYTVPISARILGKNMAVSHHLLYLPLTYITKGLPNL